VGNRRINPKPTRIPPERYVQKLDGIVIKAVLTLRRNVKIIIDAPKLAITIYGVALLRPVAPAPITTGNNGKMHGAKTVSIPAKNEITKNVILID
jgi:hypothetical protein